VAVVPAVLVRLVGCRVMVSPPPVTVTHGENSEVLLAGSVAVAVMTEPPGTTVGSVAVKFALQFAPFVTQASPK
jgi:hypothetical protein